MFFGVCVQQTANSYGCQQLIKYRNYFYVSIVVIFVKRITTRYLDIPVQIATPENWVRFENKACTLFITDERVVWT